MTVEFKENAFYKSLKDIYLREEKKLLKIHYGANGDLYFGVFGVRCEVDEITTTTFEIDRENEMYLSFEKLYNSIINHDDKQELEELLNGNDIKWYSDETYDENANVMIIKKENEKLVFTFINNPEDPTRGFGVRICNHGSKYDPLNIKFMDFYNSLQNNDIKDNQKQLNPPY